MAFVSSVLSLNFLARVPPEILSYVTPAPPVLYPCSKPMRSSLIPPAQPLRFLECVYDNGESSVGLAEIFKQRGN